MGTSRKMPQTSNKNKSINDLVKEYGEGFKDAIFNNEDCKKLFDERIKAIRIQVTEDSIDVVRFFYKLLPELSDNTLNLSDIEGEYDQMISLLKDSAAIDGEYTQHPGIFLLIIGQIRKNAGKLYCSSLTERQSCYHSCASVLKSIKEMHEPIRDAVITEFWDSATDDQKADIRAIAKHRANPQGMGMPGNGGIAQYSPGPDGPRIR